MQPYTITYTLIYKCVKTSSLYSGGRQRDFDKLERYVPTITSRKYILENHKWRDAQRQNLCFFSPCITFSFHLCLMPLFKILHSLPPSLPSLLLFHSLCLSPALYLYHLLFSYTILYFLPLSLVQKQLMKTSLQVLAVSSFSKSLIHTTYVCVCV